MGIYHFSGLFVLLCIGLSGSLLTSLGEHVFYRLVLPRIKRKKKFNYWLHTSQVGLVGTGSPSAQKTPHPVPLLPLPLNNLCPPPALDHHPPVDPQTIARPSHTSGVPHRKSTGL